MTKKELAMENEENKFKRLNMENSKSSINREDLTLISHQ